MNGKRARMLRQISKTLVKDQPGPERETVERNVEVKSFGVTKYNSVTVNRANTARAVYLKMKNDYKDIKRNGVEK